MLNRQHLLLDVAGRLLPLAAKVPRGLRHPVLRRVISWLFAQSLGEGAFDLLKGRWLCLEIRGPGVGWCVARAPDDLHLIERPWASVTIRGDWRDSLLLASRHEDPDTLFFRRRLMIEDDTELGLAVKNLLDSLDPEYLPPWLQNAVERTGRAVQEERGEAPQAVQDARGG